MNITRDNKQRCKGGDLTLIKSIIGEEMDRLKNHLVDLPMDTVEETRGRIKALREVLKLIS